VISVTFQQLSLEAYPFGNCEFDSVTLYDGSSANSPQLGKYCIDMPATITSSGSSLFVVFKSDFSVNNGHFSLSWTLVSQGGGGQGWYSHIHWLRDIVKTSVYTFQATVAKKKRFYGHTKI